MGMAQLHPAGNPDLKVSLTNAKITNGMIQLQLAGTIAGL
jgi:hypothetical protein